MKNLLLNSFSVRSWIGFLGCLSLTVVSGWAQTAVTAKGPVISFETPVYEFGSVMAGEVVKANFVFKNLGDQVLEIKEVKPSCGCTTAGNDWPRTLQPGQTGIIPIQLATDRFQGQVTKTVKVDSNSVKEPSLMLTLRGEIKQAVEVNPSYASFRILNSPSEEESMVVKIVNHQDEPLKLGAPESNNPMFQGELKEVREGKEYELLVKTVPPLAFGSNRATLQMKTGNEKLPVVSVNVYGMVRQPIMASPTQILLPAKLAQDSKKYVTVRSSESDPLELTSVELLNGKGVEVQVQEIQKGKLFRIAMVFPAGYQVESGKDVKLMIKTNHASIKELETLVVQTQSTATIPTRVVQ